jgi:hypothetical protein
MQHTKDLASSTGEPIWRTAAAGAHQAILIAVARALPAHVQSEVVLLRHQMSPRPQHRAADSRPRLIAEKHSTFFAADRVTVARACGRKASAAVTARPPRRPGGPHVHTRTHTHATAVRRHRSFDDARAEAAVSQSTFIVIAGSRQ